MEYTGYFVRFNNFATHPAGTGRLHIDVLNQYSQVIWGQWRTGVNLLNEKIYNEMNNIAPFYFYALDKSVALLKMQVIRVLTREEVINEQLEYLIPNYYDINTPCSAYYLIDKIEILPAESAMKVININTKKPIYDAAQVNSTIPWRVCEIDNDLGVENIILPTVKAVKSQPPKATSQIIEPTTDHYCVYQYYSKTMHKSYIGLTNDIARRKREHENPGNWLKEKKKYLYTAMQLMGLDDFEFHVLHSNLSEVDGHYWEAKEIENHNAYFPDGFNERKESRYLKS